MIVNKFNVYTLILQVIKASSRYFRSLINRSVKSTTMAKYSRTSQKTVESAMHRMKKGKLKSGSGDKVKNPKQAIAIGLSEAREKGSKVPSPKKAAKKAAPKKAAPKKSVAKKSAAKKEAPAKKAASKTASKKSAAKKAAPAKKQAAQGRGTKAAPKKKSAAKSGRKKSDG
jgi:hypothetical protein